MGVKNSKENEMKRNLKTGAGQPGGEFHFKLFKSQVLIYGQVLETLKLHS